MAEKIGSAHILKELAARHTDDFFMTEVKDGPTQYGTHYRMDAVAVKKSWAHPCVTAYEVKVNRQDFLRDEKWPVYLNYCHKFSFACPEGLIQKDELPPEVGLYWYRGSNRPFKILRHPVYRTVEIPESFFMYVIMSKIQSDRWPFFDGKEEYFREWLENKRHMHEVGINFGYQIAQKIADLRREVRKANGKAEEAKEAVTFQAKAIILLRQYGIAWQNETWIDGLKRYLESGTKGNDFWLSKAIEHAKGTLNYLEAMKGKAK